jgi:hypothetical protein
MNIIAQKYAYIFNGLLIAVLLGLLTACTSSGRTVIDEHSTEASANFAEMKTYRWDFSAMGKVTPDGGHTAEFDRVVCDHVDKVLGEKGYKRVASGNADFTLDYRVTVTQEEAVEGSSDASSEANDYGFRWTFDKDESPSFKGLQPPKSETVIYRNGTLHLAAFNQQNQTIWHSSASRILNERTNEAERRAALRVAVNKIMRSFP